MLARTQAITMTHEVLGFVFALLKPLWSDTGHTTGASPTGVQHQVQHWSQQFPCWGMNTSHSLTAQCFTTTKTFHNYLWAPDRSCEPHRPHWAWLSQAGYELQPFFTKQIIQHRVNVHKFHSVMNWGRSRTPNTMLQDVLSDEADSSCPQLSFNLSYGLSE